MSIKLNTALYHRALGAAHAGSVTHDEWSAPKNRTAGNSIAHDESQKGNADEYAYPIFAEGGKLSAKGVGSALAYAKKNNAAALVGPLEKISAAIKMHSIAASADPVLSLDAHRYASTQIDMPEEIAEKVRSFGKSIAQDDLDEEGVEKNPHVTVKYGLHSDSPKAVKSAIEGEMPVRFALGTTHYFPANEKRQSDALVAQVHSPDLHRLNQLIAGAAPHVDTHSDYMPHATIAYLKPGRGEKYAYRHDLSGIEGMTDTVSHSSADGKQTKIKLTGTTRNAKKMALSAAIFSLSTPEARPILTLGIASPKDIDGHPVYARRKEIARAGHYVHRGQKDSDGNWREFDITPDRMRLWADAFQKRKAAGIRPFVPERHVESAADARANMGYVDDLQIEGDSLYATMHLIGEDALAAAARNDVSIYVIGDATDANGEKYDECIEHVCLTANPVIPNLQPFVQIAASADRPAISAPVYVLAVEPNPTAAPSRRSFKMTDALAQQVRAKLGFGAEVPDDQLDDKAAEKALALSAEVPTLTGKVTTLTTERDALATERDTLKSELATAKTKAEEANNKVLQLSADAPNTTDPLAIALITRSFKTDRERVIESGVISEAGMKEVDALMFSEGKPTRTALALSAGGVDPFYSRLCDIIRRNPGIKTNNGVPRGTTEAERLALAADPTKREEDKVDPVALAEMRRYAHLPTPAAK